MKRWDGVNGWKCMCNCFGHCKASFIMYSGPGRHLISGTAECESYSKEVFSKATFFAVLCWF